MLTSLFFAVTATVEWRRLPLTARLYTGVATALALASFAHAHPGSAGLARVAIACGLVGIAISVATGMRRLALRR